MTRSPGLAAGEMHGSAEVVLYDEATAYIADALMQLALEFENAHFAQIRRHHQAIAPETVDARQFDLFRKPPPWDRS